MLSLLRAIATNRGGNVLPISAAAIMVLLGMVGSGVDMSRSYLAKQRLQAACDAGALAGRRAVGSNGFDTAALAAANSYFRANFNEEALGVEGTEFSFVSQEEGNAVAGTATTRVPTLIMRVFGFDTVELSASCLASMGVGNSDVTMVLDVTGSMNLTLAGTSTTRLQALRQAMKNFYDTLDAAMSAGNARIRYSLVPFSSTVNVGRLLYDLNPSYLADRVRVQSRVPTFRTETTNVFAGWSEPVSTTVTTSTSTETWSGWTRIGTRYSSDTACNAARPANMPWANNGTPSTTTTVTTNGSGQQVTTTTLTQPQSATEYRCNSRYLERRSGSRDHITTTVVTRNPIYNQVTSTIFNGWLYQAVEYDTSLYKTFATISLPLGTDGAAANFTWPGCIEERATTNAATFSFSSMTGISPSAATDLDIDTPPSSSQSSKWAPLLQGVAYYRTTSATGTTRTNNPTSPYGRAASIACPSPATLLAEMDRETFFAYADALIPVGGTYHDLGMIWGGRLSSPDGMFADIVNEEPANGAEVARHLIYMTDGEMDPAVTNHSAYGVEWHDRRVSTTGLDDSNLVSRHNSRFLAVCEAVKAKGIRVWVIAFATDLTTELQTCASPDSSFTATNSTQLNAAFQEIAKRVGELRVVQ